MKHNRHKIIISTGGTGGHIYPAIAVARALNRELQDPDIRFIGAKGKMEMQIVASEGFPITGLWISGLQRSLSLSNLSFPIKVISALKDAFMILRREKPAVVVGFGGYASGPTLFAATLLGIPTLIQEQNAFPGLTNRILARRVKRICLGSRDAAYFFPPKKIVFTGNPIRQDVIDIEGKSEQGLEFFGLEKNRTTILVIGGSQGALSINKSIAEKLEFFNTPEYQLLWQTGKYYFEEANKLSQNMPGAVIRTREFIKEMDLAYAVADIIISRAGAIAVAELCAVGKPVIFIPLPTAAENHQYKNAQALVHQQAAVLIPDHEARQKLTRILKELSTDKNRRSNLGKNMKDLAIIDADVRIAKEIIDIMKK